MAVAFDSTAGSTNGGKGTGTGEAANVTHAANAMVVIVVQYLGTTSPNSVTVGGAAATSLQKTSRGSTNTTEMFYLFRAASGTDSVSVGFAANTVHAWSAACYTGSGTATWEANTGATGAGSSPQTAAVTVAAGQSGGLVISGCGAALGTKTALTMAMAPANGETERREDELTGVTGGGGNVPIGSQIQDVSDAGASHACQVTVTASSGTIGWAIVGARLLPSTQSISISDTASETDSDPTVAVAFSVSDTASETDANPSVAVAFTVSDTATETDSDPAIAVAFTVADTAAETDSDPVVGGMGPTVDDTAALTDADPGIAVALTIDDAGLESDAEPDIGVALTISDTAVETDADPDIVITVDILDVAALTDADPAISVDLSIDDLQTLADSDPAIEALITILDSIADISEVVQVTVSSPGVIVIQLGEGRDIYPFE